MAENDSPKPRVLVVRGLAWNTLYQIFEAGLAFGAMLVLVRIIPPAEYGRWGAVLGLLTLLNSFNFGVFAAQALQLPEGREPDWSLHWSAGLYIQTPLMLTCHALAGLCWLMPNYRPIAPLLHLAAFGLILDWPAQLRGVMLRRALDFGRLKILMAVSATVKLAVTLGVGLAGGGAYALVLGSNVVSAVPFVIDLLVVQRWRPRSGWWRWPNWTVYRPGLRFGLQQAGSAILFGARGALETVVLPGAVGYPAIGLLNRARALFSSTVGRVGNILVETIYPLLPCSVADPTRYARQATLFAQVVFLTALPGALYVGLEGRALSRLLYGERWIAADPLIWPATLAGLGLATFAAGSCVLLAANRLRSCFVLDFTAAALSLPMVAVAWAGGGIVAYTWAVAAGQLVAAAAALAAASSLLTPAWVLSVLLPPVLSTFLAMGAVMAVGAVGVTLPLVLQLCLDTGLYGLTLGLAFRGFFPGTLATVLSLVPGGDRLRGWLRLPVVPMASAAS